MRTVTIDQINAIDAQREKTIFGSLLLDGGAAMEQCLRLRPEMFGIIEHRLLFRRITGHLANFSDIDPLRLKDILESRGEWSQVSDGLAGIVDLTLGVPRSAMLGQHVSKVVELWKHRRTLEMCNDCVSAVAAKEDADAVLSRLQSQTLDLTQESATEDDPSILANTVPALEEWRAINEPEGLPYGLPTLDRLTGGMYPGEVTVIGARNGVGKTSQLIQTICVNCRNGVSCDVFSLEMTRKQILRRIWSVEANVSLRVLRRRDEATPSEVRAVSEAAMRAAEWPLRIFDRSSMDVQQIVAHARVGVKRHKARIVCVDYAQIVPGPEKEERLRVQNVSRALTAFAKDSGAHVLLLSQLRKVSHEQYRKPPTVADLRETGQLGDDAHAVCLYHRAYNDETGGLELEGEVIIPKQRSGETRALPVRFNPRVGQFEDVAQLRKVA